MGSVWADDRELVIRLHDADVRAMGMGDVWDRLVADDNTTTTLLLGIIGAVATYLSEQGYEPPTEVAA